MEAMIIQNGYGCSWCWNPVRVCHSKEGDYISCGTDDCRGTGLITLRWIEKQIQDKAAMALEAREVLKDFLPKKEKLTEKENMRELGF